MATRRDTPQSLRLPEQFTSFRPVQEEALDYISRSPKRIKALCLPTGAGKSLVGIGDALRSKQATCYVTDSRALQDQILHQFESVGIVDLRGRGNYPCGLKDDYSCEDGFSTRCPYKGTMQCPASEAEMRASTSYLVVTNYDKWIHSRRFGQGLKHIQRVIFDEAHCFVPGTSIQGVPIEAIRVGDILSTGVVTKLYKSPAPTRLLHIVFKNGRAFTCTPKHLIYTSKGWTRAEDLTPSSLCAGYSHPGDYQVSNLWESRADSHQGGPIQLPEEWSEILQSILCSKSGNPSPYDTGNAGNAPEKDDDTQSHEEPQSSTEGKPRNERPGTFHSRGERHRSVNPSTDSGNGTWVVDGTCDRDFPQSAGIPQKLQGGHREPLSSGSHRSGWEESPQPRLEEEGYQESPHAYLIGVDRIEVYEQSNPVEFGRVCRDGYVYNLEVAGSHIYLAEGIIVHNCGVDALARAMQVTLGAREIEDLLHISFPDHHAAHFFETWKTWAQPTRVTAEDLMKKAQTRINQGGHIPVAWVKRYHHLRNLCRRLAILSTANVTNWVVDEHPKGYVFDPIQPGRYVEGALLLRVPDVLMMSATLRPKTLHMMGIGNALFDFKEFPSDFDPKRCPIYYVPTMRVDAKATDLSMLWIRLDQMAAARQDRNGLVHTISFNRRDEILSRSRFASKMLVNERGEPATAMVEQFKRNYPGAILVSPSIGQGFDFSGKAAEYQFICKVPFPPPSKVLKARTEVDKEYPYYLAMTKFVQMCGRIMRDKDDQGESVIADDHFEWFMPRYRHLAPGWFNAFVKRVNVLPQPPARLK